MNTLDGTDGDEGIVQDGLKHEAKGVREEAQLLETETRDTEQNARTCAAKPGVAEEISALYDVLNAAGTLVAVAKEGLSEAPAKRELRSLLRNVVESAAEIVNDVNEYIRRSLTAGHGETPPDKDQKTSK